MTSVLYSAGLNYQGSNPLRTEIRGIRNEVTDLRTLVTKQSEVIDSLVSRLAAAEKSLKQVGTAISSHPSSSGSSGSSNTTSG